MRASPAETELIPGVHLPRSESGIRRVERFATVAREDSFEGVADDEASASVLARERFARIRRGWFGFAEDA